MVDFDQCFIWSDVDIHSDPTFRISRRYAALPVSFIGGMLLSPRPLGKSRGICARDAAICRQSPTFRRFAAINRPTLLFQLGAAHACSCSLLPYSQVFSSAWSGVSAGYHHVQPEQSPERVVGVSSVE